MLPPAALEQRRLLPTRNAPGGPVVQNHRSPAQLLDVDTAVGECRRERARQARPQLAALEDGKAELGRGTRLPAREGLVDAIVWRLRKEAPGEEGDEQNDEEDGGATPRQAVR